MRPGPKTASVVRCQVISVIITEARSLGEAEAEAGARVRGLVLEAPFNKMEDEVKSFSAAQWTSWLLGVVSLPLSKYVKCMKQSLSLTVKPLHSGHCRQHQDG